MATIFVHIGLPKTATTSLQIDLFPHLAGKDLIYIGVNQPRTLPQHVLYKDFYKSMITGEDVEYLRDQIGQTLKKGVSLLVSEEMFTVSEMKATWRIKLRRLSAILEGFDYRLIVTVRRPVDAMFSYYVELFPQFSKTGQPFSVLALKDERMEIFHYRKLFFEISKNFMLERVFVKSFEELQSGENHDLIKLIVGHEPLTKCFKINNRNSRKKIGNYLISRHSITVAGLMRKFILYCNLSDSKSIVFAKRIVRPFTKILDRLVLKTIKVEKPTDEQMDRIRLLLADETGELNRLFDISY